MSPAPPPHVPARPSDPALLRRVALSSLLGTVIEYYDFLLYGTMAALVLGELFFPESDPTVGTVAAFGTLAAGYVARPLGGAVFGHFGDRLGRRAVVLGGAAGVVLLAYPVYALVDARSPVPLILGMVLGQVVQSAMYAPLGPLLPEMFGTRVRYTGASLGYQLAALIGGGFTPMFAGSLLSSSEDVSSTPLVVLAVVCGLVTALAVRLTAETRGRDPSAEDPEDPAAAEPSRTRTTSRGAQA